MNRVLAAALMLAGLAAAGGPDGAARAQSDLPGARLAPPEAATGQGGVVGTRVGSVDEFLGIPYAAPPVGALRFAPPAPPAAWKGLREATHFGSPCLQPPSPFGTASRQEDCLFLNVYRPAARTVRRPVMVWIHGGAFSVGEGSDYDGSALALRGNVVVVTLNYRLGALGFLTAPSLDAASASGASGDYGLMDQQAALRWVRANIAAFGGDPGNVTIFGESAGGASVVDQMVSPPAAGLFHKAIIESGAYAPVLPTLAAAEQNAASFDVVAGCGFDPSLACLRALPAATIYAVEKYASASFSLSSLNGFGPVTGGDSATGAVLPMQPLAAIASGRFDDVPVIDGTNRDEFRLFVALAYDLQRPPLTATEYPAVVASQVGLAATDAVLAQYPLSGYASPDLALATLLTDGSFACNALLLDRVLAERRAPYAYEFDVAGAQTLEVPPASFPYDDTHTDELGYLFPALVGATGETEHFSPEQAEAARTMQAEWTAFATFGTPNGPGLPFWPPDIARRGLLLNLATPSFRLQTGFAAIHKCAFWGPLLAAKAGLPASLGIF